jgi:hypothetical protein
MRHLGMQVRGAPRRGGLDDLLQERARRLAQTLFARCFEGGGPPCQLIEHLPGGLIEMLKFARRLAVFNHGQVIGKQDVNGAADRRHLQLYGVESRLLYRATLPGRAYGIHSFCAANAIA